MDTSSTNTDTAPPAFPAVNVIELVSVNDSKITSVSVYSGRAEVTRLFKLNVKAGQNHLNIVGLPGVLDRESFRVEGRGSATIHDVTLSNVVAPPTPTSSPTLTSLLAKKKLQEKALARAVKSLSSLETYLASVNAEYLDVSKLRGVVHEYDGAAGELDDKVTALENELKEIDESIKEERQKLSGPTSNEKLNVKAIIGVFADFEGEVKIAVVYAVKDATWSAGYDIRVDMQTKEKPVTLIYKASITQITGEDWDDVPLTLETATPTFGVGIPNLTPWTLSTYRSIGFKSSYGAAPGMSSTYMAMAAAPPPPPARGGWTSYNDIEEIQHRGLQVSSKGNVSATFGVPGLINIPSDGVGHSVTIVRLSLDAAMSWLCVPKLDGRVHLKAKIKNASEYTLLAGKASVYVDGSFISKSNVPLVSADESFDCPLGLDPSIRITYHPRNKKTSQSGFYNRSSIHTFTQRVTVHNTKSASISGDLFSIKIIDQVPISEDSTIVVKLMQPALVLPSADGGAGGGTVTKTLSSATGGGEPKLPTPVKVAAGVVATWDGADEASLGGGDVDMEALGKEGRFCWICSVPPQGKVGLTLQWEVSSPLKTNIVGL